MGFDFFQILFFPAQLFIYWPYLAFLVCGMFTALFVITFRIVGRFRGSIHIPVGLAVIFWIIFGINEIMANGANIRIDLLFLWPNLSILSLWAIIMGVICIVRRKKNPEVRKVAEEKKEGAE